MVAGVGDEGELFEEAFAVVLGEDFEDFGLEGDGDGADFLVDLAAVREKADAMGAAVAFVFGAFDEAAGFHAFEEAGDGVGIAADDFSEGALGEAFGFAFGEGAQDGELVGGDASVEDTTAKGLVEAVPAAAEEGREAAAFRGIDGEEIEGIVHWAILGK